MPSRTISLEQSAYERLAAAKRPGESFSDVVNRLTAPNEASLLDLVGILSPEDAERLATFIDEQRKRDRILEAERRRRLWGQ